MHVLVVDALAGSTLYDGEVHVDDTAVRVRPSLAGRVVTFDASESTTETDVDSPTFHTLYNAQFVVLTGGVALPVRSRRYVETETAILSLLETPTGWVPHRLLVDAYDAWTPTPELLAQIARTAFPSAEARDFASVQMTRRDRPGMFALRAARVFSPR